MDIGEKEIVCILGPSGCGKSTLMKILGGIQAADEGSLLLTGRISAFSFPGLSCIDSALCFRGDNLLQWRTAEGNLSFMLETMHLKGEKWQKRIDEMLEIVGLSQYPQDLSSRAFWRHEAAGRYCQSASSRSGDSPAGPAFWRAGRHYPPYADSGDAAYLEGNAKNHGDGHKRRGRGSAAGPSSLCVSLPCRLPSSAKSLWIFLTWSAIRTR